jgi:hypothetical protein
MKIEKFKNIFNVIFYGIHIPRITGASCYSDIH